MQEAHIQFPPDSFFNEAKKEYSLPLSFVLVREFIQNSLDAKATEIHFNYDGKSFSCSDNGDGMDKETLIAGMLTYAGSVKDENSCGGFGAAKKLLLFSHLNYSIETWNIRVKGHVGKYTLEEIPMSTLELLKNKGTRIKVELGDWWIDRYFEKQIRAIVMLSDIDCQIYYNGVKVDVAKIKGTREFNGAKMDVSRCAEGISNGQVFIRFNGLYMFTNSVNNPASFFLDVKGHSREALNQSRESFRYGTPFNNEYNGIIDTLNSNSISGFHANKAANETRNKICIHSGIEYRGAFVNRPSKREKMIASLAYAIMVDIFRCGFNFKDSFGFIFDNGLNGLYSDGKMWVNPDKFQGEDWELDCAETIIHEYTHFQGYYQHDESFIKAFGQYMTTFIKGYSGISPLRAKMRQAEKILFS